MIQKFAHKFRSSASRPRQTAQIAAIYLQAEQLKLVLVRSADQAVLKMETVRLVDHQQRLSACGQLARELPKNTALCLVLSADCYQLVQLDKPPLAEAEMLQALPWQIRDLVSIPTDDLIVDYCDVAVQANQQQAKIQVVASSRSLLAPLCKMLQQSPAQLLNIQPEEWLARNFLPNQPQAVLLLSHQPGQELNIQIVRNGTLYVSRKLRGFNHIDQMSYSELSLGLLDNLLLEVQRSLDFFEGQMRQAPVKEILFLLPSPELPAILQYFVQNGFTQVRALDLAAYMPGSSLAEQADYWLPLAGALELLLSAETSLETTH
jgi:MSHA biogenesis protein MshI